MANIRMDEIMYPKKCESVYPIANFAGAKKIYRFIRLMRIHQIA